MEIRGISSVPVNRPAASTREAAAPSVQPGPGIPAAGSSAASPDEGKALSAGGGFISPFLRYDQSARVAVLYFRDIDTGETRSQIPSARVVEEYRRTAGRVSQGDETGSTETTRSGGGSGGAAASGTSSGGAEPAAPFFGPSGFGAAPADGGPGVSAGVYSGSSADLPAVSGGSYGGTPYAGAPSGGSGLPQAPLSGGNFAASPGGLVSVTV